MPLPGASETGGKKGHIDVLRDGALAANQAMVRPMKNMCTRMPVANDSGMKRHLFGVADSCMTTRFMTQ